MLVWVKEEFSPKNAPHFAGAICRVRHGGNDQVELARRATTHAH